MLRTYFFNLGYFFCKQVFYLAVGAQGGRSLGIEGETAENVISGIEFLRGVNQGKGKKLSGKTVVIGGWNVAVDVARTAIRQGSKQVEMYCLESRKEMPALDEEVEEAEHESISFHNGWGPKRILTENGRETGVEFMQCISVFDENHRFAPKYDENNIIKVTADTVLLSIGQAIEWGGLLENSKAKTGRGNTVMADAVTYQTAQPDVFAGGDCLTGPKFAIHAIAAGKEGAISIHRYVQPGQDMLNGRDRRDYKAFDKDNVVVGGYDSTPRQRAIQRSDGIGYQDARTTFTEDQMRKETERCLGCGAVQVDSYMCIGCGLCTTRCKFDAIHLEHRTNTTPDFYEKLPIKFAANAVKRSGRIAATAVKETVRRG